MISAIAMFTVYLRWVRLSRGWRPEPLVRSAVCCGFVRGDHRAQPAQGRLQRDDAEPEAVGFFLGLHPQAHLVVKALDQLGLRGLEHLLAHKLTVQEFNVRLGVAQVLLPGEVRAPRGPDDPGRDRPAGQAPSRRTLHQANTRTAGA